MALASRLTPAGDPAEDPEDFFEDSLGVVFDDDAKNMHGDASHGLLYQSPHLPRRLHLTLADPKGDQELNLFSHYLWNSSLLLAEFIEAGTLLSQKDKLSCNTLPSLETPLGPALRDFDVTNLATIELGAGTALPSLLAALLGARRVVITDHPTPAVLANLRANADRNIAPELSPLAAARSADVEVEVAGHAWGHLATAQAHHHRRAFDRVLACDCLWMPSQHDNLLRSIEWFLGEGAEARCWVVGGFHTGRASTREFFRGERLAGVGLEAERIWERDCDGAEREWSWDRGVEDVGERKRWLVFAVLRRRAGAEVPAAGDQDPGAA